MSHIKELFYKMEYDQEQCDIRLMPKQRTELLEVNKNRKYEVSFTRTSSGLDPIERAILINNISEALEKEFETLVFLERKFRYFNKKDAKVSVRGLIENLRYYSGHTFVNEPYVPCLGGDGYVDKCCPSPLVDSGIAHIEAGKYQLLTVLGRNIGNRIAAGWNVDIIIRNEQILATVLFIEEVFNKLGYGKHIRLAKNIRKDDAMEKSPMIVFNNADLQAASYSAVQAVWGFQGLMFWNVNTIFVQEEVFADFVNLFKEKLLNTNIPTDISKPKLCETYSQQFNDLKAEVTKRGFGYWLSHKDEDFSPMLIINDRLIESNVIQQPKYEIPFVTILSFRHTSEAISLANNRREYLASSIWTESISLANEVSRKLQKDEQLSMKQFTSQNIKAQKSWGGLSAETRRQELRKVGFKLRKNIEEYMKETGLNKTEVEEWIRALIEAKSISNNGTCDGSSDIKSYREPIGVIGIYTSNIIYAITAVSNGNLLLVNEDKCQDRFVKMMTSIGKCLPGVLKIVTDISSSNLIIEEDLKMDVKDYGYLTTKVKNVWYNFEDSI